MKKIYMEPSSQCNFHCKMCFRENWIQENQGLMTEEVLQSILGAVRTSSPREIVFGGMGEPLLHPKLPLWVKEFHEAGCRTAVITNGSLLDYEKSTALLRAGLDELWISVEGFSRQIYGLIRSEAYFDRLTENIMLFNGAREQEGRGLLGITFVMMKENLEQLPELNAFAERYHVDEINLSHAIPNSPIKADDVVFDNGYPVGRMQRWHKKQQTYSHYHCKFIEEENVFVRWDGDVAPCMQLLHETYTYLYEQQRHIRRKSFGNVLQMDLWDIWYSENYREFRERVKKFDFPDCARCDGCDDRLANEKDCMMNFHPTCGACLWGQGMICCP